MVSPSVQTEGLNMSLASQVSPRGSRIGFPSYRTKEPNCHGASGRATMNNPSRAARRTTAKATAGRNAGRLISFSSPVFRKPVLVHSFPRHPVLYLAPLLQNWESLISGIVPLCCWWSTRVLVKSSLFPPGFDAFKLSWYAWAIVNGNGAKILLHPMSYFGAYPYSGYPKITEFILAFFLYLTKNIHISSYFTCFTIWCCY